MTPKRPFQQGVQQRWDEIKPGLDGDHHAGFKPAGQAQEGRIVRRRRRLAGDIVDLNPEEVANAVGEKDPGNALLHHVLILQAGYQAGGGQQRRNALVRLAVDINVVHSGCHHATQP